MIYDMSSSSCEEVWANDLFANLFTLTLICVLKIYLKILVRNNFNNLISLITLCYVLTRFYKNTFARIFFVYYANPFVSYAYLI